MKTVMHSHLRLGALAFCAMIIAQMTLAQNASKATSGMVKVILENEQARVMEIHLQPGESIAPGSRSACIVYFLTESTVKSTLQGKDPVVIIHKAGESIWREPMESQEENVGNTEARALVIEMKNPIQKVGTKGTLGGENEGPTSIENNRDKIINDLNNLAAYSYQYRIRPKSMGGGEGSYMGFTIPKGLSSNKNASFEAIVVDKDKVQFAATSLMGYGAVRVTINEMGVFANWEYSGKFKEMSQKPTVGVNENKDAMINDLNNLAAMCYQFRVRPKSMGGGEGSYKDFAIPKSMHSNESGTYSATVLNENRIQFRAISLYGYGVIQVELDDLGRLMMWYYTDKFK